MYILPKKNIKNLRILQKSRYLPLFVATSHIATHERYATLFAIAGAMLAINNYASKKI
ncbi:hypothetical protein Hanom_Chr06g00545601 [Helianthus anomalus]